AADLRRSGRARQPPLSVIPRRLQALRPRDGPADARHSHSNRQSGERQARHPHAAAVQRCRRAGHRAGAGRRSGAGGPHWHVQLPAHGRGTGRAPKARRSQGDPVRRTRGRGVDGKRTQVRRPEGRLSHRRSPGDQAVSAKYASRAARGFQARGPDDHASRGKDAPAGLVMAERAEPPAKPLGPNTLAVHAGEPRPKPAHALATPIVQTATFTFANTQELRDHFDGKIERVEYGRYGNPTQKIAEAKLAALEGAGDCLLFASGMAAMTTALFAMLS